MSQTLPPLPLPPAIRSRQINRVRGLSMHVLEAGDPAHPCIVLLHGFPELAFSWRDVMPTLAEAGYYVVAPDQRGYGRTTGADTRYDTDLAPFRRLSLVEDLAALLKALGVPRLACLVGHDLGAPVAAWAALTKPELFGAVVLSSAPFAGPPSPSAKHHSGDELDAALAGLDPPRLHYQRYYGSAEADGDMLGAAQGLTAFLRGYFHLKSGDVAGPGPEPLTDATPQAYARLPTYYVMERGRDMAQTVADAAPDLTPVPWLTEEDLAVYVAEYGRTGFQGGLNWYRAAADPQLRIFHGKTVDIPATFIAGARDFGVRQTPGAFEAMAASACTRLIETPLIPGAGHWVHQEAPDAVSAAILAFLKSVAVADEDAQALQKPHYLL